MSNADASGGVASPLTLADSFETRPLPHEGGVGHNPTEARMLMRNFWLFALIFSLNQGAVLAVVDLASSFGEDLGSYSIGLLCCTYVLSATLFGSYLISRFTAKRVMVQPSPSPIRSVKFVVTPRP